MYSRRTGTRESERDRSPSRGPDRRASMGYAPRSTDEPNGAMLNREPPRGPKALDQARSHSTTSSRGRPFSSRPDFRDRERERERDRDRDYRGRDPSSFGRRDDHRSDWSRREREASTRDSRTFPSRRSRSPPTRDRRDSRYSPPASADVSRSHRDPKDGIAHSSSRSQEPSTSWLNRGGSYRGWGHGDYDRGRGRGSFPESDTYRTRSRSREPWRERDGRDERERYLDRDADVDRRDRFDRRDVDRPYEREDREKDTFALKRERPPSRNSLPGGPSSTVSTPIGNPTASSALDKTTSKALTDSSRRYSASTPTATKRDLERGDYFQIKQEALSRGHSLQRAISPPPAPQVPAFGAPLDFSGTSKKAASVPENEGPRSQAIPKGPLKMASAITHQISSVTPTGPKAERDSVPSGTSRDGHLPSIEARSKMNLQAAPIRPTNVSPTTSRPGSDPSDLSPKMSEKHGVQSSAQSIPRPPQTPPTGPKAAFGGLGAQTRIPIEPASPASLQFAPNRLVHPEVVSRGPPIDAPKGPKFSNKQWVSPAYAQNQSLSRSKLTSSKPEPDTVSSISQAPATAVLDSPSALGRPPSAGHHLSLKEKGSLGDQSLMLQEKGPDKQAEHLVNAHDSIEDKAMPNLEDEVEEDEDLDLNEEDFAESEKRHQRDREALLARRPLSPFQDRQIVERLLKLQLLQILATGDLPKPFLEIGPSTAMRDSLAIQHAFSPSDTEIIARDTFPFGRPLRQLKKSPGNVMPTPPLEDLPFIESKSQSPSRDWLCEEKPLGDIDEEFIQKLWRMINDKREAVQNNNEVYKDSFKQQYKAWRLQVADLDRKRQAENPTTPVPASPPLTAAPTIAPTPIIERTRGAKNMTELDLQNILKASEHTAREEQERRDRGSNAKADPEKEALIPNMLSESERDSVVFEDTGQLIPPGSVLNVFDFIPLEDDFTSEEQKIFTDAYVAWPKKWGKIAESLPGRDFQQCIIHYYLTKQTYKFKDLVRKNQGRRGRRAKGPATRPKSNALMADLGVRPDVYEGDEFDATPAVTDTGRPRRAAAPTFGDSAPDTDTAPGTTTRQRGGQVSVKDVTEPNTEKPAGRGKRTGAKAPRKPKGQQALLATSTGPSPQKADREPALATKPPRGAPKVDSTLLKPVENQGPDIQRPLEIDLERSRKLPIAPAAPEADNPLNTGFQVFQQPHQPSSYWSVYEVKDFPRLLAHFGRDYEGISHFMRTKTAIMVKNYFVRQIENGKKELEQIANMAEEKKQRGEPMGPPPAPANPPKRKYDASSSSGAPRPLAPSTETAELEEIANAPIKPPLPEDRSPPVHHHSPPSNLLPNPPRTSQANPSASRAEESIRPQNAVQSRPSQGPRIGFFNEERRDSRQPPAMQMVPQQPASMQLLPSQPPEKARNDGSRHQTILPQRQNIAPQPVHQTQTQFQTTTASMNQPSFVAPAPMPQPGTFGPSSHTRNPSAQSLTQPSNIKQDPDIGLSRRQEPQPPLRPFKASPVESPIASRPPAPLPLQKDIVNVRPNPAPLQPTPEPPRAAPAKRSNLMSLLNDEPVEPQPNKRVSADPVSISGKPSIQSPSTSFYPHPPQPLASNQPFSRRDEAPLLPHQQPPQHLSYRTHANPAQMHPPSAMQPQETRDFRDMASYSGSPAPSPANQDWINRFDPRMSQHHTPPSGTPDPSNRGQQLPVSPYPHASASASTHQTPLMASRASTQPSSGNQYHRMTVAQQSILPANPSPPPQAGQPGQIYRPPSASQRHSRMPSYGQPQQPLHIHTSSVSNGHSHSAPSSAIPAMHRQPSIGYETRPIGAPPPQGFPSQQQQLPQQHVTVSQHHNVNPQMAIHPSQQGRMGPEYPTQPNRMFTPPNQPYGLYQHQGHHRQYSQGGGEERR